jgi:hypothetical protein
MSLAKIQNKWLRRASVVAVLVGAVPLYVIASVFDGLREGYEEWLKNLQAAKLIW